MVLPDLLSLLKDRFCGRCTPRVLAVGALSLALTAGLGCGDQGLGTPSKSVSQALSGDVHGGQQPIAGATIQLYATGDTGDGSSSMPLFLAPVRTNGNGQFNFGLYTCPSPSANVYLTATGGNPGLQSGATNANIALMLALGPCGSITASTWVSVNERSTVAAVYALAPFMQAYTAVGSAHLDSQLMTDAFAAAGEMVNPGTGAVPGTGIPAGQTVPAQKLSALANILATCINSSGGKAGDGSVCGSLFTLTTPPSGVPPEDTVQALLNLADHPSTQVVPLYLLSPPIPPYQPTLVSPPPDWTLSLSSSTPTPVLSPAPGTYASSPLITVSDSNPNAQIYYTSDGSTPTTLSEKYTGALSLPSGGIIRAIAVSASIGSLPVAGTYAISAPSMALTPSSVSLGPSQTQVFSATISGLASSTVTWSLSPSMGSISQAGVYTAPASISSPQIVTLSATSVVNPTLSTSAVISLVPPVSVMLTPGSVSLSAAQSQAFTATVLNTSNIGVTWSLAPAVGTISSAGVYTAPVAVLAPQTVLVTATSVAHPAAVAVATIALTPSATVVVTPGNVTLSTLQSQAFTATVGNATNTRVTWSISPAIGTISAGGIYLAPTSIAQSQTVTITASSVANPSISASVTVALLPPGGSMYYVSNQGSDGNDGKSPSTPWQTIAHVNAQSFSPGDSILFQAGGTWREQLTIRWTGSAIAPLTFSSYGSGAAPILSGANLLNSWTSEAVGSGNVYFSAYSVTPVQVFKNQTRLTQAAAKASLVSGQWWLDTPHQRIYVFDNPAGQTVEADQRQYAIYAPCSYHTYVTVARLQLQETQYQGMYECGLGIWKIVQVNAFNNFNAGIRFDGPASGTSVIYSTAAYNGGSGLEFYDAPNILVAYDTTYNNAALPGNLYAAGIKLDPSRGTVNAIVEYSTSYSNGLGQTDLETGSGIWSDTIGNGLVYRYNTVYNNNQRGLDIDADDYAAVYGNIAYGNYSAGISAFADNEVSITGNQIYNNTVWGNGSGIVMQGHSAGSTVNGCMGNSVTNNIIGGSSVASELVVQFGCENPGADGSGNTYTYNSFGPAANNFIQWGSNTRYSSYSAWEADAGNCGLAGCTYSLQTTPMLANPSASVFTLQAGSPAIGAGAGGVDLGAVPYAP